jgi:AraC family transcriptional regulator
MDHNRVLGFGLSLGTVVDRTACDQAVSLTAHRRFEELPAHSHVNDYLCMVLRGAFIEVQGKTTQDRSSGYFFTYQAGETHYDRYGSGGGMTLALHFGPGELRGGRSEGSLGASTRVTAEKLAFELASNCRDELVLASLAAEIKAEVQTDAPTAGGGEWMERVVEAISDDPRRRWSLGELAAIAGRHPVRLAQSFRTRTGLSLGEFQRFRRLTSLSVALRRRPTPLAALAAEFGYCDQSHMSSEFHRTFGSSPGRYRGGFR